MLIYIFFIRKMVNIKYLVGGNLVYYYNIFYIKVIFIFNFKMWIILICFLDLK